MARKELPLRDLIVTLDPGKFTGVSIYSKPKKKFLFVGTKDFYSVQLFLVRSIPDRSQVTVLIEAPRHMLYQRNESTLTNEQMRIMWSSGGNARESELLEMCLTRRGYQCILVPPVGQGKWRQEDFDGVLGSLRQMNQHMRDSVRLCLYHADNGLYQQVRLRVKAREEGNKS